MKTIAALSAVVGLIMIAIAAASTVPSAVAQEDQMPGMCNGRTDANLSVNAHANGPRGDAPKYILNISSDSLENISGVLILGQGRDRLEVTEWCRLWHHLPDQPYGDCDDEQDTGSTNVHAVGIATLRDGQEVLVRTDVRENDEGLWFRVRYRAMGDHDGEDGEDGGCEDGGDGCGDGGGGHEEGGCEDEGWTKVPEEGWLALDKLKVRGGGDGG